MDMMLSFFERTMSHAIIQYELVSDFGFITCILKRIVRSGRKIFLIHIVAVTVFISTMIDFPSDGVKTRL